MSEKEFRQKVMPLRCRMYNLALRTGMPPDDAADAVQEALLSLWRMRHRLPEEDSSLIAYCLATMRHECVSMWRKKRETTNLESLPERGTEVEMKKIESSDTLQYLESLIDSLPEGQQRVLRLSGFAQFDISEIAEATGFSQGNVRQLLSRGRRRIRELMQMIE